MPLRDLVEEARAGRVPARETLARRWLGVVYAAALAVTGRAVDAEDATQEAFCRAFAALDGLRDPDRFGPWLRRIARNAARDLRRERRGVPLGRARPSSL